ncbi:aminotransferase class I/II-fold pyridoxal phosphate-dependent enzyme [Labilibaculum sp.]|uniref:DegT/DnrJ/EryC1/StrS family aminotransferase n=1 Tax=Labilibaculum sp. TaxID=2060723 RepID=UPI002AA642E2|nr:aminotransferase class I/II-fold pyridoxal phosphate-dependent enzyme [Labilibaculum sp.]
MKTKIWLSSPHMGGNEMKYVQEAYDTNWVAPLGPNVNGFEADLQNYTGTKHASALSAGTAAIHLSLILLGVKAGDEVIASSFTFSATVNPISYLGASPILIDSEKDTWNMCPIQLEKAIQDRIEKGKKPKAIVVVYLYGMPAKIEELLAVANKYDIPLIEDAAEALGSKYKGKCMGTFGKFGILSFNGNKIITTSGGGALISDDQELIAKSRFLATQARDNAPHYQHSHIGYNYRMSNIVAGIGRGQMEVLDERVAQRRANFEFYKELFSDIEGVSLQEEPNKDFFSNFWLTSVLIDPKKTNGISREDIRLELEKENIECRPLWKPMHMQPVFAACPYYGNGVSEELFEKGLCLPSGSNMTDEERERIKEAILKLFKK